MTPVKNFMLLISLFTIPFYNFAVNQNTTIQIHQQPKSQTKQKKQSNNTPPFMCFCVAADDVFFEKLLDLIGSIHRTNFDKVKEIAVFDLGFTKYQLEILKTIEKISIHSVEERHPDILKHFQSRSGGKPVRGWYAWKPVVLKQGLSLFPHFLYLDAGCSVIKSLNNVFTYIKDHGYLLVQGGNKYAIGDNCTKFVANALNLNSSENNWILSKRNITAGIQGISNKIYDSYIKPIYELTTDLRYFEDDGSSPLGFGWGRHDQTLFSIQANLLELDQIPVNENFKTFVQEKEINICIGNNENLEAIQILFQRSSGKFTKFIKYKK